MQASPLHADKVHASRIASTNLLPWHMAVFSRLICRLKNTAQEISNYAEPNSTAIGIVGVLGPAITFFVVRYFESPIYEGLIVYLIAMLIPLPLVFYRYVPKSLKRYFPVYLFVGGMYALSFDTFYLLLKNHGGEVWYLCVLGSGMFLIIVIYDRLIIALMMTISYTLAILLYVLSEGPVWPGEIRPAYIMIFLICYVGGIFLNHRKQVLQQEKVSLMKSLSGSIAHEMRNPLNAITLAMENIQSNLPDKPDSNSMPGNVMLSYDDLLSIHEVINDSIETVNSGNRMISSILSNLREGEVDKSYFRRCSVSKAIETAIETYSYKNPDDRKLIFTDIRASFDFFGEREQFIYVLFNLVNNALYYSQRQGFRIDISTGSSAEGNFVKVRDSGPGIPAAYRNRLFTRFFSHGKQDGNGLGLSFCKRVVESCSASITCDSVEGAWTEFTIVFPPYDSRAVETIKRQILTTKRVLVVDDHAINRVMHARYLSDLNCRVDQAADGRECLEMASATRYDMILMDIEMPTLSGDETVRLLRSGFNMSPSMMLHYRDAAIIGITALPKSEAIRRTLHAGMNEFFPKPLNCEVLMGLFENYFFNDKSAVKSDPGSRLSGASIMVADDNQMIRKILGTILEKEGYRVSHAEHGLQVLELLRQGSCDLVLMDMEMPVMDGIEAVRAIREDECFSRFRDLPIIAITGNTDPETIRQVTNVGMNAHIGKPVRKRDLLTTISFWLDYSQNQARELRKGLDVLDMHGASANAIIKSEWSGIDPAIVESLLGIGGKSLLLQLFDHFRHDAGVQLSKLEAASIELDLLAAHQASHSIKGSASSIGAVTLSEMARQLDDGLRQGSWPSEAGWFAQLKSLYEETCRSLHDCMCCMPDHQP